MDTFQWLYSDIVKDHFINPRNVFKPEEKFEADAEGMVGNVKCGDQMLFLLKIKDD
ncbi:MAG: iron-sulfur cluster assembly scaffold protein, partial [Rectinema sp.]